jgi:PAS domain S-box-containing protein
MDQTSEPIPQADETETGLNGQESPIQERLLRALQQNETSGSADALEHERRAAVILDGMYQFVGLLDPKGNILEINRSALEGAGQRIEEIRGTPFWTARWWQVSEELQEQIRDAIRRAAAGEFVRYEAEVFGEQAGFATIIVDFSLRPIRGESGEIEYLLPEARNITERKQAEEEVARQSRELRVLNERLKELDRLKTQFFANVSHEFRTPLTLMLGPLEDALANAHGVLPLGAATDLAASHRNALRLLKLVNTMLDFSRIEAGRVQASYQPVDLAAFTAELATNFRSACEKAGLRLIVDCPPLNEAEPVFVDRDMWEKIVLNLVSNAFKFTLQGEIAVRLEAVDGYARLTVRDTGVGIPSDELPRMFERFHRIEQTGGRTHEGTGIGLALVQELVKLHGGTVSVDSAAGEGSTFTVAVPFGTAHLDPERIGKVSGLASTNVMPSAFIEEALGWLPDYSQMSVTDEPRVSGKPSVLWADDNADMRDYVARLLSGRFDVRAVPDGEAALAAARAHPPDLVLSDVMMPKLDGFGLLRALRADPVLREIPVILLSARAGEESRIEGLEVGADDYLVKPFSARELIARVETHVKSSRLRREAIAALRVSEDRFKTLANAAPAILWITESDASCSFLSRGWYDFTGQTEDATPGFGWLDAVHPNDREQSTNTLLEANRRQEAFSLDCRMRRSDGEYRWVMTAGEPRFDPQGNFAGYIGSVIDIHERKQAAQASALLSAIVDSSDDAIISKDLNGVITSWNQGAERLFGYTSEEVTGKSITIVIPSDRLGEEPEILSRLQRGERVDHFETIRKRKDGALLNISLTISPVKDAQGRVIGASKVARDITDRKRKEQVLEALNAALTRSNADLQQFAYSASHDLQEPLRMVATYSELLKREFGGQLGPAGDEYIRYTIQGALRMEQLLGDLRAYTLASSAAQEPTEDIEAGPLLDNALAALETVIKDNDATITRTVLPRVRMHEFQLEQVFQNLIGNAIRYRSSEPPRIHVAAEKRDKEWLFSVRDNGIGIDPQYKEQIFELFKRLHSTAAYPGTGMGLAICHRIVERAGGRIWVESGLGRGATFFFTVARGEDRRDGA